MAKKFNLLPQTPAESKFVKTSISKSKKALTLLSFLLVITLGSSIAYLYYLNTNLKALQSQNQSLRQNIKSLESTEQSLILLKDRIAKIQSIMEGRLYFDYYNLQVDIIDNLPEEIIYSNTSITSQNSTLELKTSKSVLLSEIINKLNQSEDIKNLTINKISFNNQQGFTFEFNLY